MVLLIEQFFESLNKQIKTKNFLSCEILSHFQYFDAYIKTSFFLDSDTLSTGLCSSFSNAIAVTTHNIFTGIATLSPSTTIQNIKAGEASKARIDWSLISSYALASCKRQDFSVVSDNTDLLDLGSVHALSAIIFNECDVRRYVLCIILCSTIESLLARCTTVYGNERQILRQILQSLSANERFPKSMEAVLDAVFLPTGFNIRNLLWHGFLTDREYSSSMLLLLVCLLEKLRCLLKEDNVTRKSINNELLSPETVDADITYEWKTKLQMMHKKLMMPVTDASTSSTSASGGDGGGLLGLLSVVWNKRKVSSLVRRCCLMNESMKAIIVSALSDYFDAPTSTHSHSHSTSTPTSTDLVLAMLKMLPTLEHMLRILFSIVNPHCGMFAIASKGDYFTTLDGFGQRMKHQLLLSPCLLHSITTTTSPPISPPPDAANTTSCGTTSSTTARLVHQGENNHLPSALGSGLYALLVDLFMTDDGLNARAKLAHGYQLFNRFLDFDGPVSECLLSLGLGAMFDASIRREYQMLCEILILIIVKLCLQFPENGHNCRQLARYVAGDDTYKDGSLHADDAESIISAIAGTVAAVVDAVALAVPAGVIVNTDITADEVRAMSVCTSAAISSYESAFHPLVKMKKTLEITMARFQAYSSYMATYKLLSIDLQSSDVATVAVEYVTSDAGSSEWVRFTDKVDKIMDYIPHYRNNEQRQTDSLWNLSQQIVTQCRQLCNVLQHSSANLPLCRSLYESIADRITHCCENLQIESSLTVFPPPHHQQQQQHTASMNKELLGMDEEGQLLDRITGGILSLYSKKPILKVPCLLQLLEGCCSLLDHSSGVCESLKQAISSGEAHTAQRRKFLSTVTCTTKVCIAFAGLVLSCIIAFIQQQADDDHCTVTGVVVDIDAGGCGTSSSSSSCSSSSGSSSGSSGGGTGGGGSSSSSSSSSSRSSSGGCSGISSSSSSSGSSISSSDILFTRLFNVLIAILPSFGATSSASGDSSSASNKNSSSKGYEKSLIMLLNVITSKKIAHAVAILGAPS